MHVHWRVSRFVKAANDSRGEVASRARQASMSSKEDRDNVSSEEETPALVTSVGVHLMLLVLFALLTIPSRTRPGTLSFETDAVQEPVALPLVLADLDVQELPTDSIGVSGQSHDLQVESSALQLTDVTQIPPPDLATLPQGRIEIESLIRPPTAETSRDHLIVKGSGGTAVTGTKGAIDRLTHEILLSLEQRPTLVVWLFDQTASLSRQRSDIRRRLGRIYQELGNIQSQGSAAFQRPVEPLLSSVIAFGQDVSLLTPEPTADVAELESAVAGIPEDDSGVEHVFQAIHLAVSRYHRLRTESRTRPARNIQLIAFTDEVGDDQALLDRTVAACQRWEIPVYVVGIPAPFGRHESLVKWVDPNPNFDQSPKWGLVNQGPETFMPERLQLRFADGNERYESMDSGFGPYALTRLCVETGGIYFTVHPNRQVGHFVPEGETDAFASRLSYFFSPDVMRKYRPDYVAASEYEKGLRESGVRAALVEAARQSAVTPLTEPPRRFVKLDDAQFAAELTEAQKAAARLIPQLDRLHEILKRGEADRPSEESLRWQAGYDLAMGRILAVKVRTEGYNEMLAQAKRGLPLQDPKNNTLVLKEDPELAAGGHLAALAEQARAYLERVVDKHQETPWALLAKKELETPLGWKWRDSYTQIPRPRPGGDNGGNPPPPSDDERQMLQRARPSRPVPRL